MDEIKALFDAIPKRSFTAIRNRAMLSLMLYGALRVSEACDIELSWIDWKENEIKITGKGNVQRINAIPTSSEKEIDRWKDVRKAKVVNKSVYFFCTHDGNRLNRQYVYAALKRYANRAIKKLGTNVDLSQYPNLQAIHPHMLRHTGATMYYKLTGKIEEVKKFLGHKEIATTDIYTHLDASMQHEVLRGEKKETNEIDTLKKQIEELKKMITDNK